MKVQELHVKLRKVKFVLRDPIDKAAYQRWTKELTDLLDRAHQAYDQPECIRAVMAVLKEGTTSSESKDIRCHTTFYNAVNRWVGTHHPTNFQTFLNEVAAILWSINEEVALFVDKYGPLAKAGGQEGRDSAFRKGREREGERSPNRKGASGGNAGSNWRRIRGC